MTEKVFTLQQKALLLVLSGVSLTACVADSVEVGDHNQQFRGAHANGLVLHWTFQDRNGSQILDISGHGHHGTIQGGTLVNSPWGEAISLDGIDDYISFVGPRAPQGFGGVNGAFTISAQVKVTDVNRYNILCTGCAPLSHISIGTSNVGPRVNAAVYNQSTTGKLYPQSSYGAVTDNTWANVTMVVEGGVGTKYYIDCDLDSVIANTNVGLHDYNYSSIGQGTSSATWYNGEIDDLRVWNRALGASEIATLCEEPVESPCDGAPEAATLGITLPTPPSSHVPPMGTSVSTTADLVSALDNGDPIIVLEDGLYTTTGLPTNQGYVQLNGQQLWARNSGAVTLPFGVLVTGYGSSYIGSEVHGIVFDIEDDAFAAQHPNPSYHTPSAIMNGLDATHLVVEDCIIHGHGVLKVGVLAYQPEALEVRRLEIDGMIHFGIYASDNLKTTLATPIEIHDIRIRDITDPLEEDEPCGITIGHTANVSDIHIRDVRGCGILTGQDSDGAVLSHLDIDRIGVGETTLGVGVYIDNATYNLTVENFCVGPNTRIGINSEWDHNSHPFGTNTVITDGLSEAYFIGVGFGQGTRNGDVQNVVFRNYNKVGIFFHNNLTSGATWPAYDDGSTQSNNTFEVPQDCSCAGVCDFTRTSVHFTSICEDCTPSCP